MSPFEASATEGATSADMMTSFPVSTDAATVSATQLSVNARYPSSMLYQRFITSAFMFNRVLVVLWLVVGLLGNTISAIIWLQKRMRRNNSSAVYIAALSINCIVFLVFYALNALKFQFDVHVYNLPVFCEAFNVFYFVPQYLTQLLVLAFTVDRYIVVCHPMKRKIFCRPSRAVKVIIGLVIGTILSASFLAYVYVYENGRCDARRPTTATALYMWSTEMTFNLLAPIATIVLNIIVIKHLPGFRRSRSLEMARTVGGRGTNLAKKSSKTSTTLMLLSVSFFYVATTLPTTFVYIAYPSFHRGPDDLTDQQVLADVTWRRFFTYRSVEFIVSGLCVAQYACNFFIFIPTGRHFRQAFCDLLTCRRTSFSE